MNGREMEPPIPSGRSELTALLIAPDRVMAESFLTALAEARSFQVLADLKSYPPLHTLEIRLRQIRPEVILLDTGSGSEPAGEIMRFIARHAPEVQVVALHPANDPQAILSCLRAGASEFLQPPFDPASQQAAIGRLRRLREPDSAAAPQAGNITVFSAAKSGSGASTLAMQTAFAVARRSRGRVLLADFDLTGGTVAFHAKVDNRHSFLDALRQAHELATPVWDTLVSNADGIDILSAPETPYPGPVEPSRVFGVLEFARRNYSWIIVDLPVIFERLSLTALSNADRAFLVSTAELPSLHLARKAVRLLDHLGFTKDRFQMLVNRVSRRDELPRADMEKLLNCPVHSKFPNDYFSLHRMVTLGRPPGADCEFGKMIGALAGQLCGGTETPGKTVVGRRTASAPIS